VADCHFWGQHKKIEKKDTTSILNFLLFSYHYFFLYLKKNSLIQVGCGHLGYDDE
jgi:hypothetical protein